VKVTWLEETIEGQETLYLAHLQNKEQEIVDISFVTTQFESEKRQVSS
jgi:hypothetical protein